ncbi:hypothetical protein H310_15210, partial [Aphanomyces invadans]
RRDIHLSGKITRDDSTPRGVLAATLLSRAADSELWCHQHGTHTVSMLWAGRVPQEVVDQEKCSRCLVLVTSDTRRAMPDNWASMRTRRARCNPPRRGNQASVAASTSLSGHAGNALGASQRGDPVRPSTRRRDGHFQDESQPQVAVIVAGRH